MTPEMKQQIDRYWDEDKHDKIVQMISLQDFSLRSMRCV